MMARCTEDGPKKPSTPNSKEGEIPDTCKSLVYSYRRRCLPSGLCANIENKYEDKFVSNFRNSFGYTTYRLGGTKLFFNCNLDVLKLIIHRIITHFSCSLSKLKYHS